MVNREKGYYRSDGGPEKVFDIGCIDHLKLIAIQARGVVEDAIRYVSFYPADTQP